ncbi:DnaJ C-terminal domain-containing protein [Mycoplasmopsis felis]|uniref:DnaJ C-terminal domain-containing protein n=1 Tax=Mycoplasmopsis felis TaxID=33923 RepID=UPI002AFFCC7F|nr:DnaJ C-terminal domain-containing protein [Mycoplasmopsis felis]WQQ03046.1 DnaJ C-terminal domain-containing protein [Mycoplasmopsis felis]
MSNKRDYYEVLGVSKTATEKEIKTAYRNLAKKYHPDKLKDGTSDAKMQELNEAYEVLSDSNKRSNYDNFGHQGANGFGNHGFSGEGGFGGFGDIFKDFFSGFGGFSSSNSHKKNAPRRGDDLKYYKKISFKQMLYGDTIQEKMYKHESCLNCGGSGAQSSSDIINCSNCHGSGVVYQTVNSMFGRVQQETKCRTCSGKGKIIQKSCSICKGKGHEKVLKTINIPVPQGAKEGMQVKLAGFGNPGKNSGPSGDLYIEFNIEENKFFKRDGMDLYLDYPVSVFDIMQEKEVLVPGPYGEFKIKLSKNYESGQIIKIIGKGIKSKYGSGDLKLLLKFIIPDISRKETKKILESLEGLSDKTSIDYMEKVQKTLK